jgi:hypothetical protein
MALRRYASLVRRHSIRASRLANANKFAAPANKILIGTHHKTGTVWLKRIFRAICYECDWQFHDFGAPYPDKVNVIFETHSEFPLDRMDGDYRGLHMIRDPRDRIVSGCFYHQKSVEPWLHQAYEEFGGKTYQEMINSFDSFDEKLMFELENSGRWGINEMLAWDYENPKFKEVKYEDLIKDTDLLLFHEIFSFLGISGEVIPTALRIAYNNSLFSGNIKKSVHVRSGSSSQWQKHFKAEHRKRFQEVFPDALTQLGYEENDDWVTTSQDQ